MEWVDLIIGPGGVLVMFIVIVFTGARGDWIFGREQRRSDARWEETVLEVRKDRDEWKAAALQGTQLASQAVTVVAEGQREGP